MGVESGARPSRTLSGELRGRPLAVLLAGASERGTSGTFAFTHGTRRDSLTMRLGKIAVVRTSEPVAYLGGVLYDLGAIDMATLDATLHEVSAAKRLHGDALVACGALTRERVEEGLVEQTLRKLEHLFSLPEDAKWTFREDVDELAGARDEDRPLVETWPALWRALRNTPPTAHVGFILSKIEGAVQLKDLGAIARFGLAPDERALCERLHARPSTLAALESSTPRPGAPASGRKVDVLVYLLALGRCLTRVETPPIGPAELGIEGVRERARRVSDEAPHTTLGIARGASVEAARAAYFRLARLWHPDRLPPAMAEVREECRHVFTRIGEAHRLLVDTVTHVDVDAMLGRPAGVAANDSTRPPPFVASLRDADAALARGDIEAAKAIARNLTSAGSSGPGARAILAWCAIGGGAPSTGPHALDAALAALDRVLTGDPDCVRALYYRAQVHKRLGNDLAALRDHRRVARLEPGHRNAQHEVEVSPIKATPSLFPSMLPPAERQTVGPPVARIPPAPRLPHS